MADSLEVFRDSMIKARALVGRAGQGPRRQDRARRADGSADRGLRGRPCATRSPTCRSSATAMQTTAQGMSDTAEQSSSLVNAVAAAAEETSVNVQTVSAGTEQLSSSIAEIGRQVVASAEIAKKAVAEAGATDATMQGLADNASRISVVVDLIQVIASQTNLACSQRDHRGGARGRSRPRLCGGRLRGQEPRQPDREGHRRDPHPDRQHAAGRFLGGDGDPQHRRDHRRKSTK